MAFNLECYVDCQWDSLVEEFFEQIFNFPAAMAHATQICSLELLIEGKFDE